MGATLTHRTETVRVEALSAFFDGDPEWKVRGLSAGELLQCNSAAERQNNISEALEAVVSAVGKQKIEPMQRLLGLMGKHEGETAKRLEMLTLGSLEPQIELNVAVRVAEFYPLEFMQLTNTIGKLTSEGADPVKRKPSGKTQK